MKYTKKAIIETIKEVMSGPFEWFVIIVGLAWVLSL